MLRQEKENSSILKEEHSKKIQEKINRIEETNARVQQLQQEYKNEKQKMKENHEDCKKELFELLTQTDISQGQFQRAASSNDGERYPRLDINSEAHLPGFTQFTETKVQSMTFQNSSSMPQKSQFTAQPETFRALAVQTSESSKQFQSEPTRSVLQEPVRSVTENLSSNNKPQNQVKNQQEPKNQSTQKTTQAPQYQKNRSDETLPCFLIGKLQEEKMLKFLKRIQINKPIQPSQNDMIKKHEESKEVLVKQKEDLPQSKPNLNSEIVPTLTYFQVPEAPQQLNQSAVNQSAGKQTVANQSDLSQSVVNQSIVDQSAHNHYFQNDFTVLQEDENFGMKSKADDFFVDSSEEEGQVSLDASEQAQESQDSSQNETANEELREKLLEVFDSDDIHRLNKHVLKSDIPDLIEFLERNRNELTFTSKLCKASHIAVRTSATEVVVISCLSDQVSSLEDGYQQVINAIKADNLNLDGLSFVIE